MRKRSIMVVMLSVLLVFLLGGHEGKVINSDMYWGTTDPEMISLDKVPDGLARGLWWGRSGTVVSPTIPTDTVRVPYLLDLGTRDQNGRHAVDLTVSADTDGDNVYGYYINIDTGTTGSTTSPRKSYGIYTNMTQTAGSTSPGAAHCYAMYNAASTTGNRNAIYGIYNAYTLGPGRANFIIGLQNDFSSSNTLSPSVVYGIINTLSSTGTAELVGMLNLLYAGGESTSTMYSVRSQLMTKAGTIAYGDYIESPYGVASGGTQYGVYVKLEDPDVTSGNSIYVTNSSLPVYFGPTVTLNSNPMIGTGAAGTDYAINFVGETNTGSITFMEDEDRFEFDNDIRAGGGITQAVYTNNVSSPPTSSELDGIFGARESGFTAYIDDNGAETDFYQVVRVGSSWFIFTGTKAP